MCAMHAYDYAAFGRRAYLRRSAFKATSDVGTISFVKTKRNRTHGTQTPSAPSFSDGLSHAPLYSGMHKKVTQRVGWVENPTSPQAV